MKKDITDLVEPFSDEAMDNLIKDLFKKTMPDLVRDLPLLKYVKTGADLYGAYKVRKLRKRMKAFLQSLLDGKFSATDYEKLSTEEQDTIMDIIMTELDSQTDNLQSEALGLLVIAYVSKKIDRLTFMGIAHELKNINPLVFYFNVDGFTLSPQKEEFQVFGPTHYLPPSFTTNSTQKLQFSSQLYLSNLGKAFFKSVYQPMSKRYLI